MERKKGKEGKGGEKPPK